ncbi:Eco57I restriction-modification methylase domain-containing protein, partial [Aquiflexum sp.]|uniref:Eco57I restriction-modification methylase domain-containing protein n=1 Tax=Aquiflexum sp. TaxID=1872584 RepID=UPI003593C4BB
EFNILGMQLEEFKLFWLILQKDNLLNGIPKKIKEETLLAEEKITKQLYADYSSFKQELWQDMVAKNPEMDELLLYKKSQKLLDRFLFIFFAEDKGLLPPNSIMEIVNQWVSLKDLDAYTPLYDRFKLYFGYLNTGRLRPDKAEIHAYNGGLFAPDPILDTLQISDGVIEKHVRKITEYDFESEVDTNILGHIFEHSLNDIENVRAQLAGQEVDKSKTKRKRDGVFYTPKYITKYIVDNTLGRLCTEKKTELGIIDEDFAEGKRGRQKKTIKRLKEKLDTYRTWLLQLTICDPACGSGAFLNQVLEFLMAEHRYVDELESQLFDSSLILPNVENHILENNIFGVDINEESVQIARLSLWLRTAKKGRKLSSLNSNIKVGNSLIDDPEVAGDLAFNWNKEFPQVFAKGGFDVVVGNPPYVSSKGENFNDLIKSFLTKSFESAAYQIDLYILFLEKGFYLINQNGIVSFIVPNSWTNNLFLEPIRKFILNKSSIKEIVNMPSGTFEAAYVDTIIIFFTKKHQEDNVKISQCINSEFLFAGFFPQKKWGDSPNSVINIYVSTNTDELLQKIEKNSTPLYSFTEIARGVGVYHKRVGHTKEFIESDPYQSNYKKDETFVPYLRGRNVSPWRVKWNSDSFISYGKWLAEPREPKYFFGDRIVLRQIPSERLVAAFVKEKFITDQSVFIAVFSKKTIYNPKGVLGIISSKLMAFYFRFKYSEFDDLFPKLKLQHFKDLPIKTDEGGISKRIEELSDSRIENTEMKNVIETNFNNLIDSKFSIEKISTKLQNWPTLDFKGFLGELKKAKVKLSLTEEAEWMAYFNEQKEKALALQTEINRLDAEIDQMVYELYGLTEEEIRIVEGGEKV